MHIVQVYHRPVPVKLYGGMERVIENLCEGFIEQGHKVSLICFTGDYKIPGVQFISLDKFSASEADKRWIELLPDDFDIVHFHLPMNQDKLGIPYVMTMHGNLKESEDPSLLPKNSIFLTADHAHRHGRSSFVFNGLNPATIPLGKKNREDYFSFLGRASLKRKGLHLAKKIARDHKKLLKVGGGNGLSLFGTKYLGHVNNEQKFKLLGDSKAFLFPILWEEPFGLVIIEALFSGTPVWALSRGSVPELLSGELLGKAFLHHSSLEKLIEASRSFTFDVPAQEIRHYAEERFTHTIMCEKYLKQYEEVLRPKQG